MNKLQNAGKTLLVYVKNRCPNQGLEVRAEQTPTLSGPSPFDHVFSPNVSQSYMKLPKITPNYPKIPRFNR